MESQVDMSTYINPCTPPNQGMGPDEGGLT